MKSLTKSQIVETSRLTLRQVQFYTEEGLVVPEIEKGEGRGKSRRYSWTNLVHFLLIKELVDHGMTLSKIRAILNYVKSNEIVDGFTTRKMHKSKSKMFLIIAKRDDGKTIIYWRGIPDVKEEVPILSDRDLKEVKSAIIIDYTKILKESELA
jgi:DNA-binding transcriptional MerR regulator